MNRLAADDMHERPVTRSSDDFSWHQTTPLLHQFNIAESGRIHTTEPFGAMLFAQLAEPTAALTPRCHAPPSGRRGLAMPTRKRTRADERAYRVQWERGVNRARRLADPPPF